MRFLLTGVHGFVGRHWSRLARERGGAVAGIVEAGDDRPEGVEAVFPADLRDFETLRAALRESRPERIAHLAGQSSAALSFERPVETFAVNAAGTVNLLEAVRAECPGARVLIVGTSEAYGPQPEGSRVAENASFRPVSPYGLSKAAADVAAEVYARVHGLDVVRTRSFAHIGPGQSERFAVPAFARQIAEAEAQGAASVLRVGNLEVTRDLTDVRDVCEAYWRLLERGRPGAAYNVCSGRGVRLSEVARMLVAQARVPIRIEVDPARLRPADVPYLVGDPGLIAQETGWSAERPLEGSLSDVLDEWRGRVAAGTSGPGGAASTQAPRGRPREGS